MTYLTDGLLNLPWWGVLIIFIIFTQITIASVTLYLHRSQSHRGVEFHPIINHFFRFWLWLTTGMNTKEWVAIHRKHHVKVETEDDPHSPQTYGLRKVFFQGTELYRAEAKNQETLERYGRGTPEDWIERNLYSRHSVVGIILMLVLDVLMFGAIGITVWAFQMMWIPMFAAGFVNGVGHFWGYRNFESGDASRNILPWGVFIGGEELHNNHHTYPTSAKLSVKWWEFDMGWMYITILKSLRLAKVYKTPPKLARIPEKAQIDTDTVRAFFTNHFQIMSRYSKDVILPVLKEQKQHASDSGRSLFRRAKGVLIREKHLVDEAGKQRLEKLLDNNQPLSQVYQYRQRLLAIWEKTSANQKELLEALQEWCKQAEATGIDVLQRFAARLKTYVPQAA